LKCACKAVICFSSLASQTGAAHRANGIAWIFSVKEVATDVTVSQRTVETSPSSEREPGVCNRVGCAVHVNPRCGSSIESIGHLGKSSVQCQIFKDLN